MYQYFSKNKLILLFILFLLCNYFYVIISYERKKVYVLDTNIILQNLQNLYKISDNKTNHIVIPETVKNFELEEKKKLVNELGFYSREFMRLLAKMKIKEVDYKLGFKVVKLLTMN